jgi:transposase InsO family protein
LAKVFTRFGYRRMRQVVCAQMEPISPGSLQRLWQLLKLQVKPRKRHRRRPPRLPIVAGLRARGPNQVWCLDFMKDRTLDGRTVRVLSVVDEYTRECLALAVQPRFLAVDVVNLVERLSWEHGQPVHLRSDNGPEFVATVVERWASEVGIRLVRSTPASPWENAFSETFHSRARDEFMEREVFGSLAEIRVLAEAYRVWYNEARPHSALRYRTPAAFAAEVKTLGRGFGTPNLVEVQA